MTDTLQIDIHQIEKSRIDAVDFDNLVFGRSFADHMLVVDFKDGEWQTPQIVPYGPISYSPAMMSLHYGQAIFEGMKAYKNAAGEILVFRPEENWKRLNKSAVRMCIPEIPEDIFMEGLSQLLRLDADWIPAKEGCSMYIRPFMFSTDEYVGVSPSKTYKFIIFNCPVGSYYTKPLRVRVETQFIRAAHGGVGFSKNAGNYGGSLYPTKLAMDAGYDQIIWTDAATHTFVEEAGTMNLLFIIDGALVTAPTGDTILDGITRKSILQVAKEWGMEIQERQLSVKELVEGIQSGKVTEAFGAGTAAVIAPIATIGYEGVDYQLPERKDDAFSKRVFEEINDIRLGKKDDTRGWVMKI
ncbi:MULTISPECIES: branched-chain amino acid aminotransferase [unclassified Arcicella]|uniref:branched-chain amino acid aminotransferase n=1 Tax=unclassified Arcicella TaxID=2644986 RepID=UPI00286715FA|nr:MULTISPECIES: branched-chain amino acid aminotransferase [unclassified Arcicella]MDR6564304.1 branched-chain amino acid aminotransferase [Arcicella sp. BE51]MDR6814055.1 branched-chain amino acid aminotransferase [Arcicella sp. BE140]MDR6825367.1 branched-chain amino acid aminotransferase [Arcicella sp. BE139]